MTPVTATAGIRGRTAAAVTRLRVAYCGCQLLFNCPVFNEARGFGSLIRLPRSPSKPGSPPYQQHYASIVYHDGGECASERRRGRVSGRGAVGQCAGLVPHERVKSVIRDTIAARRCQAVRSRVRERGKRAAARLDERAWCCQAQAARGPRTQRKVKSGICDTIAAQRCQAVRSQAWEWGKRAAQPGGSRSGVGAGASERRAGG